jgi:hypothetical protein
MPNETSQVRARPSGGLRVLAGVLALACLALAVQAGRVQASQGLDVMGMIFTVTLGVSGLFGGWYGLAGSRPEIERRMGSALRWAAMIGGVTFAAGFFGPMVLTPDSNQGPLLGIFFTGPVGFTAGLILGWLAPNLLRRRSERPA